eukprot:5836919-Pleurochrysis_carterae.AAC.2
MPVSGEGGKPEGAPRPAGSVHWQLLPTTARERLYGSTHSGSGVVATPQILQHLARGVRTTRDVRQAYPPRKPRLWMTQSVPTRGMVGGGRNHRRSRRRRHRACSGCTAREWRRALATGAL